MPLFYENRIPELQLVNADFAEELMAILEEAELEDDAEGQLVRQFTQQHTFITRPERLRTVAKDLVQHFVGRGFDGKAMYVGIDKAAALAMHDLVQEEWAAHLEGLRAQHDAMPEAERPWIASRIELMESTDMAVVVSQSQNELRDLDAKGLDIRPHRQRMLNEALDEKFKDSKDPLRIVFVCAMWMTGFDAPSVSTIYLDRPMRNHTLMQTIARANRVFPEKDNGLIVDYIGVFRNLERALAIYGAANDSSDVDSPIEIKDALVAALAEAVANVKALCKKHDIDLDALWRASGFEFISKRDQATELLIANPDTRQIHDCCTAARKLFKAVLPDPAAAKHQADVAIRVLLNTSHLSGVSNMTLKPCLTQSMNCSIDQLVLRNTSFEPLPGEQVDHLIDLSQIDFDGLEKFGARNVPKLSASLLMKVSAERGADQPNTNRVEEQLSAHR